MPKAPFPIEPELTAIAIGYRNKRLIADEVLPRVPVGKQEFKYLKYDLAEGFTIPDTKVGRKGQPNEIEFSATDVTDSTEDFGLEDPIPQADIDNAPSNYNPKGRSVESLTDLILLDREKRASDLVFNAANYATANKETLAGTDQFSDFTNSDPIGKITDSLDACIMRPTIGVMGRAAFSILARHPEILKAVHGNSGDSGIARLRDIAELFELEDIYVGEAYLNTAKKGQAYSLARVWGKHMSFMYRDKNATTRNGMTFGMTAHWGGRIAGSTPDKNIGLRGGERVRVGESVKELLTANDLGFFLQNAVA
ncbi:MAG: hypothetical protein KAV87_20825 [Desulfobacteraceae bacterium]|nr:hypothetical protein [Desulfobacteraceae bacterium]